MNKPPLLPCLPGFNFNDKLLKKSFHKSHHFDRVHNGVYYLSEKMIPGHEFYKRYPSVYARGEEQEVPAWVAYDGQRLKFKAFFQDTSEIDYRVRLVNISLFLEDGTVKVSERPTENSGLEQGILVKRQRVPIPRPLDHLYYDIIDFNVGKEIEIYGRSYKMYDCDLFTRNFLNRMGIPVPDPSEPPEDPYLKKLSQIKPPKKLANKKIDRRGQFLEYDRKILRFYGYWDDRDNLHGEFHDLIVFYHLADDTIEVKDVSVGLPGTGVVILSRMKVPKIFENIEPIGFNDPFTLLNVLGEKISTSYYIADPLQAGTKFNIYYRDTDLSIGAQLNIFGRKIVLTDADPFTKEYYRKKYGIDNFEKFEKPKSQKDMCYEVPKQIPPYNGYGSYEDSLGNCFSVEPKAPPTIDFEKFMKLDKYGFESRVLRFRAKLISNVPDNDLRQFIIRVFLMDDTVSIFELSIRNSGFSRCLFQKRAPVMLPGQEIYTNKKPEYYKPRDFYIGAILNLNGFHFQLTSADVYALRYMELHCDQFTQSNVRLIMEKLRTALEPVYTEFVEECSPKSEEDNPPVNYPQFKRSLCKFVGDKLTEHEIITIARHYSSKDKKERVSKEYVRRLLRAEIQRLLWDDLDRLAEDLHHFDRDKTGYLPRTTLYSVLRACRVPVDVELLHSMLDHLDKNEKGELSCDDLLKFMDLRVDPTIPIAPIDMRTALWWASECEADCGTGIEWNSFITDLFPNANNNNNSPCDYIKKEYCY